MSELKGRVALVTGGARGLGAASAKALAAKGGSLSLDVDHIVAVKLWESLPGAQPPTDADEEAVVGADDLSTTMNALGNCCLLEKSFNVAKGAESLATFLGRVYEFKTGALTVAKWSKDVGVDASLVDPSGKAAVDVRAIVEARTAAMKAELKEYLSGTRQRTDV